MVQSQVRFNRVPEKVWEALVQSQVRFYRVPDICSTCGDTVGVSQIASLPSL